MKEYLANLNWWAVSAILFLLLMVGLIASPEWASEYSNGAGFAAVVCGLFAVAEFLRPDR